RFDAATIGIRLDDAGAFGRYGRLLELAPVRDDRVEIDGEDAVIGRERRRLVGLGRQQGARQRWIGTGNDVHAASLCGARRSFNRANPSIGPIRYLTVGREVAEPRHRRLEMQLDRTGRAVALLADDDFRLAMGEAHVDLPLLVFRRARTRLLVGEVIFLAEHEQHDVGVLLDRAGFTQVRQLRALVVAVFDLA